MSTSKSKAKANKAVAKANEKALKKFPKAKLRKAFESMATEANAADASNESRMTAALDIVGLAEHFRTDNAEATTETVIKGWRDHLATLVMELAVAGNRFAELREAKGDKPATAKLTGYGNNVASIAKGAIEFDCGPVALAGTDEVDGDVSYRDVRKAVEARRQEKRREENPEEAALIDAKASADEAWKALRERVFELNNLTAINSLAHELGAMLDDVNEQIEAQIKAEAEADAEAAEVQEAA